MSAKNNLKKIIYSIVCFSLFFQQIGFAQIASELNIAGYLGSMHSSISIDKFRPLHLRYFSYDLNNDNFKFLFDKGDTKQLEDGKFKELSSELLKYFLIGITLPDTKFWVNLHPDSEDQIIEPELEQTDMGKVLLEADLQLKKDTAKYTSPETAEGRVYWDRLYKKAAELFGSENVNIPTLTRPWIVPGEIIIRETSDSSFIYKSTLKVMLEEDYLKSTENRVQRTEYSFKDERLKALNEYSTQLIRELIIPKLTKEVNISKKYAALRQVFYSLILSRWFKARFRSQRTEHREQITGRKATYIQLIDSGNLANLTSKTPWSKTAYFKQYQRSFAEGEYNIKEPIYTPSAAGAGQVIRSYFSGGIKITPEQAWIGFTGRTGDENLHRANPNLIPGDSSILPLKAAASPIEVKLIDIGWVRDIDRFSIPGDDKKRIERALVEEVREALQEKIGDVIDKTIEICLVSEHRIRYQFTLKKGRIVQSRLLRDFYKKDEPEPFIAKDKQETIAFPSLKVSVVADDTPGKTTKEAAGSPIHKQREEVKGNIMTMDPSASPGTIRGTASVPDRVKNEEAGILIWRKDAVSRSEFIARFRIVNGIPKVTRLLSFNAVVSLSQEDPERGVYKTSLPDDTTISYDKNKDTLTIEKEGKVGDIFEAYVVSAGSPITAAKLAQSLLDNGLSSQFMVSLLLTLAQKDKSGRSRHFVNLVDKTSNIGSVRLQSLEVSEIERRTTPYYEILLHDYDGYMLMINVYPTAERIDKVTINLPRTIGINLEELDSNGDAAQAIMRLLRGVLSGAVGSLPEVARVMQEIDEEFKMAGNPLNELARAVIEEHLRDAITLSEVATYLVTRQAKQGIDYDKAKAILIAARQAVKYNLQTYSRLAIELYLGVKDRARYPMQEVIKHITTSNPEITEDKAREILQEADRMAGTAGSPIVDNDYAHEPITDEGLASIRIEDIDSLMEVLAQCMTERYQRIEEIRRNITRRELEAQDIRRQASSIPGDTSLEFARELERDNRNDAAAIQRIYDHIRMLANNVRKLEARKKEAAKSKGAAGSPIEIEVEITDMNWEQNVSITAQEKTMIEKMLPEVLKKGLGHLRRISQLKKDTLPLGVSRDLIDSVDASQQEIPVVKLDDKGIVRCYYRLDDKGEITNSEVKITNGVLSQLIATPVIRVGFEEEVAGSPIQYLNKEQHAEFRKILEIIQDAIYEFMEKLKPTGVYKESLPYELNTVLRNEILQSDNPHLTLLTNEISLDQVRLTREWVKDIKEVLEKDRNYGSQIAYSHTRAYEAAITCLQNAQTKLEVLIIKLKQTTAASPIQKQEKGASSGIQEDIIKMDVTAPVGTIRGIAPVPEKVKKGEAKIIVWSQDAVSGLVLIGKFEIRKDNPYFTPLALFNPHLLSLQKDPENSIYKTSLQDGTKISYDENKNTLTIEKQGQKDDIFRAYVYKVSSPITYLTDEQKASFLDRLIEINKALRKPDRVIKDQYEVSIRVFNALLQKNLGVTAYGLKNFREQISIQQVKEILIFVRAVRGALTPGDNVYSAFEAAENELRKLIEVFDSSSPDAGGVSSAVEELGTSEPARFREICEKAKSKGIPLVVFFKKGPRHLGTRFDRISQINDTGVSGNTLEQPVNKQPYWSEMWTAYFSQLVFVGSEKSARKYLEQQKQSNLQDTKGSAGSLGAAKVSSTVTKEELVKIIDIVSSELKKEQMQIWNEEIVGKSGDTYEMLVSRKSFEQKSDMIRALAADFLTTAKKGPFASIENFLLQVPSYSAMDEVTRIVIRSQLEEAYRELPAKHANVSSPMQTVNNPGGIDFRVMNIVTQPLIASSRLNLKLPQLANLAEINLDEELRQLKNMLNAGIIPSGERIKDYLAACQQKGEWNKRIQDIFSCLVDICRLEEDNLDETPLEIKEALILADSGN